MKSYPSWGLTTSTSLKKRSELSFDMSPEGDAALDESRKQGETVKCIVARCSKTKALMGHVVPCKGLDENNYVTELVTADNEASLQSAVRPHIAHLQGG